MTVGLVSKHTEMASLPAPSHRPHLPSPSRKVSSSSARSLYAPAAFAFANAAARNILALVCLTTAGALPTPDDPVEGAAVVGLAPTPDTRVDAPVLLTEAGGRRDDRSATDEARERPGVPGCDSEGRVEVVWPADVLNRGAVRSMAVLLRRGTCRISIDKESWLSLQNPPARQAAQHAPGQDSYIC